MNFSFFLNEIDKEGNSVVITSGSGSAKVVAQLMRAAADEIDPPVKDPAYAMGEMFGQNIMEEFLGNLKKKPQQ